MHLQVAEHRLVSLHGHLSIGMLVALEWRQQHGPQNNEKDQENASHGPAQAHNANWSTQQMFFGQTIVKGFSARIGRERAAPHDSKCLPAQRTLNG